MDDLTRLVLVNAIYFKDNWKKQFYKRATYPQRFYTTKDQFAEVPMMSQVDHFDYAEKDTYKVLSLPYEVLCLIALLATIFNRANVFLISSHYRMKISEW